MKKLECTVLLHNRPNKCNDHPAVTKHMPVIGPDMHVGWGLRIRKSSPRSQGARCGGEEMKF